MGSIGVTLGRARKKVLGCITGKGFSDPYWFVNAQDMKKTKKKVRKLALFSITKHKKNVFCKSSNLFCFPDKVWSVDFMGKEDKENMVDEQSMR